MLDVLKQHAARVSQVGLLSVISGVVGSGCRADQNLVVNALDSPNFHSPRLNARTDEGYSEFGQTFPDGRPLSALLAVRAQIHLPITSAAVDRSLLSLGLTEQASPAENTDWFLKCLERQTSSRGRREIVRLANSPAGRAASLRELTQIEEVLSILTESKDREEFLALTDRLSGGHPALLFRDQSGRTLLTNLAAIASTSDIDPLLGSRRGELVRELCAFANLDRVHKQGDARTCGATTMILALSDVSEVSRLTLGLISREGSVRMAGGAVLKRVAGSLPGPKESPSRGLVDQLLQFALMDYGNGPLFGYSVRADANTLKLIDLPVSPGFFPEAALSSYEQLTGREATLCSSLDEVRRRAGFREEHIPLLYHTGGLHYHWICVIGVREGANKELRVFYLEPNGRPYRNNGDDIDKNGLHVIVEDARYACFSVPLSELRKRFVVAVVPKHERHANRER